MGDSSGGYSVKSMVELVLKFQFNDEISFNMAWKGVAPPRVQIFEWCVLKGRVFTRGKLKRRGLLSTKMDLLCPLCALEEEDLDQPFVRCPVAQSQWMTFAKLLDVLWVLDRTCVWCVDSWLLLGLETIMTLAWFMILGVVLWSLWKERNSRIFEGKSLDVNDLFQIVATLCVATF